MQLKSLSIRLVQWGEREGQLDGEVEFKNPKGEIKLLLTQEQISGVLALCAEALVKSTRECAEVMTANVLMQQRTELPGVGHD